MALDAASRGLATALVDAGDFGAGFSSFTSKVVWGAIELGSGHRRATERMSELSVLNHTARHLLWDLPIIETSRPHARARREITELIGSFCSGGAGHILERNLDRARALDRIPALTDAASAPTSMYSGAVVDDARLTLALARTAALRFGAQCSNRVGVNETRRDSNGRAVGAVLTAEPEGSGEHETISIAARTTIDTTGRPTQGTGQEATRLYLAFPADLLVVDAAFVSASTSILPWLDHVVLGVDLGDTSSKNTTPRSIVDGPTAQAALERARASLDHGLTLNDLTGAWFGLSPDRGSLVRPLGRSGATIGDDGCIRAHTDNLTQARRLAAEAVDIAITQLGYQTTIRPSRTRRMRLIGSGDRNEVRGLTAPQLWHRYGTESRVIQAMIRSNPELAVPALADAPFLLGEIVYAARYEMARTIDDVVSRRWRIGLVDAKKAISVAPTVADLLAAELGWDETTRRSQLDEFYRTGPAGMLSS
ncbi:MAG: hypothetical protein GY708_16600 [Actinomycetia bacterium]|nr:hypothetical protein [Actinomycetes bacterium]MCP4959697.1 hypothetical protein [Actinomycetes bacterium]